MALFSLRGIGLLQGIFLTPAPTASSRLFALTTRLPPSRHASSFRSNRTRFLCRVHTPRIISATSDPIIPCQPTFSLTNALRAQSSTSTAPSATMARTPPTKAELLRDARGTLGRAMVRFKYLMMREVRPFTLNDLMAMFSWVFAMNTLFVVVGTTTFVSLLLAAANSLRFQGFIARQVGNYMTRESGIAILFESAIVPKWRDGKITLKNVALRRLPYYGHDSAFPPFLTLTERADADADNRTMFDLRIEEIDVVLSFVQWLDGKGLIKRATIKGVRGVVDRRRVKYDDSVSYVHSKNQRVAQADDFELESFHVEDLLVTVYQPGEFRPFNVAIHFADLPRFRQQWMMYDILCARHIAGTFDNCLFSVFRGPTGQVSRIRIDGLPIDHLNASMSGPFGWITSGTVDIYADVDIPQEPNRKLVRALVDELVERIDDVLEQQGATISGHRDGSKPDEVASKDAVSDFLGTPRSIAMDFEIQFHNVRASVPLVTPELSYVRNVLIRPIVAYINNNRTLISLHFRLVKELSDFDGSWTLYDCGLADDVSRGLASAFTEAMMDEQRRNRRLKRVGLWSLQAMLRKLGTVWEYARGQAHYPVIIPT